MNTSWVPTRKWFVTQVTALAALATMYVTTGGWDQEETIAAIGIASQAAIAWLVPNQPLEGNDRGQANVVTLLIYLIVFLILIAVLFAVLDRI